MDENLVGYLLDALDSDARQQVEARLAARPELRARLERLRRALEPLAADAEAPAPPAGLAIGALARIAEYRCRALPSAPPPTPSQRLAPGTRRMPRRADLLVAAALLLVIGGLALPTVQRLRRVYDHRATCFNNLRALGVSLRAYADHHSGYLPRVYKEGHLSRAGMFVPVLYEAGLLNANTRLVCPGDQGRAAPQPPSLEDLERLFNQNPQAFEEAVRNLAGSYAYTMGYQKGDSLQGLRLDEKLGDQRLDELLPVAADRLPCDARGNSPNHGGDGQNVLYLGGNARWCTLRTVGINGDDIYLNRNNKVAAGITREDTVLGSSESSP
jgi:hypothetical protein